ncbi:MAG: RNA polymerase sigma factor [Povalibacter sp.]
MPREQTGSACEPVQQVLARVFRAEHGRIIATLIRLSGSFELAQEAMQDAFVSALSHWTEEGAPESPAAWITTTAHRKLIDLVRRERTRRNASDQLSYQLEIENGAIDGADMNSSTAEPTDRLRLIFTCCHPALNREAQVALTLRTVGGLSTQEIARAFLTSESTLAQRLVRAQRKIHDARIPYEIPGSDALAERLSSVRAVIYLIFNEGYLATEGEQLSRAELCAEAIRLARMLDELRPSDPESIGLLALLLLHDSRREARVGVDGVLITLEEQDRSRWDRDQINEGLELVERALMLRAPGPNQLQAAIVSLHAQALTARDTDWEQIAALYGELYQMNRTPIVALNRAVAIGMGHGPQAGLRLLDDLAKAGTLDSYHCFHAARAELLKRIGSAAMAVDAYRTALALTTNNAERVYIERQIESLVSRLN